MKAMKLEYVRLLENGEGRTLEGGVEGKTLYFRTAAPLNLQASANPFLAAMLIPAMQRGTDIVIPKDYPVSASLLKGIEELQCILNCWYPELNRISIHAAPAAGDTRDDGQTMTGCLFSGGLDACYSLLKHAEEITHLFYIRGIDLQLDNEKVFDIVARANSEIAAYMEKKLVIVESNIRFFMRDLESTPLTWYINQAGGLASISLAMGLPRMYVSSSNSYDALHPLGSHPLSDPKWSTEATEIIHTGCEKRRHEKLAEVAKHDHLLQRIRVCWQESGFNCGVCDKCVHYRVALTIMGLDVETMPRLENFANLYGAHVNTDGEYAEWRDNLLLAEKFADKPAAKAVARLLNRYKLKKAAKLFDEAVTGGRLRTLKASIAGPGS